MADHHPLRGYLVTYTVWVGAHNEEEAERDAFYYLSTSADIKSIESAGDSTQEFCYDPSCPENEEKS